MNDNKLNSTHIYLLVDAVFSLIDGLRLLDGDDDRRLSYRLELPMSHFVADSI